MVRRILSMVAVSIATLALTTAPAADAGTGCGTTKYCRTNYYTNSQHTTLVGQRIFYCDGSTYFWGPVTGFPTYFQSAC